MKILKYLGLYLLAGAAVTVFQRWRAGEQQIWRDGDLSRLVTWPLTLFK